MRLLPLVLAIILLSGCSKRSQPPSTAACSELLDNVHTRLDLFGRRMDTIKERLKLRNPGKRGDLAEALIILSDEVITYTDDTIKKAKLICPTDTYDTLRDMLLTAKDSYMTIREIAEANQ